MTIYRYSKHFCVQLNDSKLHVLNLNSLRYFLKFNGYQPEHITAILNHLDKNSSVKLGRTA